MASAQETTPHYKLNWIPWRCGIAFVDHGRTLLVVREMKNEEKPSYEDTSPFSKVHKQVFCTRQLWEWISLVLNHNYMYILHRRELVDPKIHCAVCTTCNICRQRSFALVHLFCFQVSDLNSSLWSPAWHTEKISLCTMYIHMTLHD